MSAQRYNATQRITAIFALTLCLVVSSCGWQLRGAGLNRLEIAGIRVIAEDRYRTIALQLERELSPRVPVNTASADHSLVIENFAVAKRVATVTSAIKVAEQQLNMALTFSFKRDDQILIQSQTVKIERLYRNLENNILASNNERRLVEHEMRQQLIEQLLRQLMAVSPNSQ
ncbi:LPS assembly lipoprotein LptE [Porticoccaceae bacterium]|nr:LPS assembly lipoprotein LptE [Porticoccaceae bacterium]